MKKSSKSSTGSRTGRKLSSSRSGSSSRSSSRGASQSRSRSPASKKKRERRDSEEASSSSAAAEEKQTKQKFPKAEKKKKKKDKTQLTAKGRRVLEKRKPQVHEGIKSAIFVKGHNTSEVGRGVLLDLYHLKVPNATKYQRKNDILPFEDAASLEFFSEKTDASLLAFVNHNKKRPHNLVLGRFFEAKVLDMIELGVENYVPMKAFPGDKPIVGARPSIVLRGAAFETNQTVALLGNMLIDFFRGDVVKAINLEGLSHVIVLIASDTGVLHFRVYMTKLKKSGHRLPRVELEECGPRMDWTIRRTQFADRSLRKQAMEIPSAAAGKKQKNVSYSKTGDKLGRVHMQPQTFEGFQTRKMKGLKKQRTNASDSVSSSSASSSSSSSSASSSSSSSLSSIPDI